MQKKLLIICSLLLLGGFSTTVSALDWRFMKNSPASHFDDEDWRLLREAGEDVLGHKADGETVSWENPASAHSGKLTPLRSYQKNGLACRQVEIFSQAGGKTGTSVLDFCQVSAGEWKIATP